MSDFKDMIAEDMESVFLNLDEFAETHNLNGQDCICILQSHTAKERFLQDNDHRGYGTFGTVSGETLTVFVRREELGYAPSEGKRFDVDGDIYYVSTCTEHMGMLVIGLNANIGG